ncbi:MAG: PAS domain-containing sensor histidine kinase [Deltaproteobacteria bacterium]|nr:PAS domain-containing sensor histidine kinase [Deltaproteobacteria bacterium]
MIISSLPISIVDLAGSLLAAVLSLFCLNITRKLKKQEPGKMIWEYLFWICLTLALFAVFRSAGHILKHILLLSGNELISDSISSFTGAVNSFMLIFIAVVTFFFTQVWKINQHMLKDKKENNSGSIFPVDTNPHNESSDFSSTISYSFKKDTEQKILMESQMAQADKLASMGQLSAGIAHEMNNPLGIILGYTQLLLRDEDRETERYKDLKTIEKHVKSCKSIVKDLLSFSRSSKQEREAINIHEAIDDVLNFIIQHSDLEKIEIIRDYDRDIQPVVLNERKIRQVFMNLIMNAKHAVGKTGTIKVVTGLDKSAKHIYLQVIDTGYGIEKKNLSRIFDPFFTTKPSGEGTGLGLSVSYGIIKNHSGEILVESKRGKGSTFTVVLPVNSRRRETN